MLRAGHLAAKRGAQEKRTPRATGIELPERLLVGTPFSLALRAAETSGVVADLRTQGEAAYTSNSLRPHAAGYFRLEVPAELVRAPGLAVFLEGTDDAGNPSALVGTPDAPVQVLVEPAAIWARVTILNSCGFWIPVKFIKSFKAFS